MTTTTAVAISRAVLLAGLAKRVQGSKALLARDHQDALRQDIAEAVDPDGDRIPHYMISFDAIESVRLAHIPDVPVGSATDGRAWAGIGGPNGASTIHVEVPGEELRARLACILLAMSERESPRAG